MEIDGHPSQDLVDELERRGARRVAGTSSGPKVEAIRFLVEGVGEMPGFWMFVPHEVFRTGVDDVP